MKTTRSTHQHFNLFPMAAKLGMTCFFAKSNRVFSVSYLLIYDHDIKYIPEFRSMVSHKFPIAKIQHLIQTVQTTSHPTYTSTSKSHQMEPWNPVVPSSWRKLSQWYHGLVHPVWNPYNLSPFCPSISQMIRDSGWNWQWKLESLSDF